MISFSCSHCDMKLKVKPEFAGRKASCPTCKHPLVVPQPEPTEGHVLAGQIDGTASSVHQAGVEGGVTLGDLARAGQKSMRDLLAKGKSSGQRYVISEEIARGGMGAVLRAADCDLRREVAVKYMLDQTDAKKKARFVEEAQITGQLEHPNIVPIHELGVDAKKRLFFSMKMVKGRSLAQVLDELRKNAKTTEKEWTLTRLLNIFVSVCNGMAYAHSRGVVNRDAKPANVMIGDFGEVYVMDWGLAKVLGQDSQAPPPVASVVAGPASVAPASASGSGVSSKVSTSRDADADLTQEGAIVGTPVYMPPEQAMGEIGEIDQRSDIYSLGAILYEMLTLVPPIEKDGGYLNILMRVSEGDIKPPEVRTPQRASKIPRELSAVAMKALAKEKKDRYQSVEALRHDIERFLEGRSVSAKQDTTREMIWKLVKRNKGFSAASFTASILIAVILFVSFKHIYQARAEAVDNLTAFKKEQEEKRAQGKKSVSAFVKAARLSAQQSEFDDALAQVDVALGFDDDYADAHLLRGQLLISEQDFPSALKELEACRKLKPGDTQPSKLADLCRKARPDSPVALLSLADELGRQKAFTLADRLTRSANKFIGSKKELLAHYQKRIESAWQGLGYLLTMDAEGRFGLNFQPTQANKQVTDLSPLQGMPLTTLNLAGCGQVKDLSPLQGMPLTNLNLFGCVQIKDLTPLTGMKLTTLSLQGCGQIKDLTPLQGMLLTSLNLTACGQVEDLSPLKGMPLTNLGIYGLPVQDLFALKGMPLTSLSMGSCGQVKDLTPLTNMPLEGLDIHACGNIKDLASLRGMPLTHLALHYCNQIQDLTPLQNMNLQTITLTAKNITKGMDVLRQMKSLKTINDEKKAYPAAEFWKRYDAGEFNK